jgi:PPOX class probable F420-dependent enzyme
LALLAAARVGRLATVGSDGIPHVVPFVFAVYDSTVYWAVDRKRKRSTRLRRLENIEANPNVALVVDDYDEDWTRLWWVRARGTARMVRDDPERNRALGLLAHKYHQYVDAPPDGPVVAIDIIDLSGWRAEG